MLRVCFLCMVVLSCMSTFYIHFYMDTTASSSKFALLQPHRAREFYTHYNDAYSLWVFGSHQRSLRMHYSMGDIHTAIVKFLKSSATYLVIIYRPFSMPMDWFDRPGDALQIYDSRTHPNVTLGLRWSRPTAEAYAHSAEPWDTWVRAHHIKCVHHVI